MSVDTVRLILIAIAERVVAGGAVSPVQVVPINTVRLILIAPSERLVVVIIAMMTMTVLGCRVLSALIAEVMKPVVTGLARTITTVVLMLSQP